MNPSWDDSELAVVTEQRLQGQRIKDLGEDVDALAKAQREMGRDLRRTVEGTVKDIGLRIEGFDKACGEKVDSVNAEVQKLRDEIKTKDERRKWSRPEKLTTIGLSLTFVATLLSLVLR